MKNINTRLSLKIISLMAIGLAAQNMVADYSHDELVTRDELRDYMIVHKADIAQRKAAGQVYIDCPKLDGSLRCISGHIAQRCTAPKGGHCSVVLQSEGDTAVCDASDGAACTAEVPLHLENIDQFHAQMKQATS